MPQNIHDSGMPALPGRLEMPTGGKGQVMSSGQRPGVKAQAYGWPARSGQSHESGEGGGVAKGVRRSKRCTGGVRGDS